MYRNHTVIAVICARGGSKGFPGKNTRLLNGKPLVVHTIEQAKKFSYADRIVVSTDDTEIKSIVEKCGVGVPLLRPKELATDEVSVIPAIIHAVKTAENYWKEKYDIVVNLGPTCPLRTEEDIKLTIKMLVNTPNTEAVFSVSKSHDNPYFNMVEIDGRGYINISKRNKKSIARRQDAPEVYAMNGSIYSIWKQVLFAERSFFTDKTRVYVMPRERSIDIDNSIDFELAEFLMKKRKNL